MSKIAESKQLKEQLAIEVGGLIEVTSRQFEMADAILRDILSSDRPPAFEERTFFKARCGWDENETNRQLNRMRNVMRHQQVSGTMRQREAADDENEKSHEILENEKPKIEKQIAALQDQLATLERNATRAEKRVEEIDTAVAELRTLLRPDIASEYAQQMANIDEDFAEIGSLKVEIRFRENLLGEIPSDFNDRQRFMELVRSSYPDCVRRNQHKPGQSEFVEPAWALRKVILTKELGDMTVRHDELVVARDKELASVNELLNFYVLK